MTTVEGRALSGTFIGAVQFALVLVQSVLLVPIILKHWGEEKYGVFLSVFALIYIFRTLDTGHQTYVGNEFIKKYTINITAAYEIIGSSVRIGLLLGLIELCVFSVIWMIGLDKDMIVRGVSSSVFIGIIGMMVMWWIGGSVGGILARAVLARGLYTQTVQWGILIKVLDIIVLTFAAYTNMSLVHLLLIMALVNMIYSIFVIVWCISKFPDMPFLLSIGSWKQGLKAFTQSLAITINNLLDQLNTNGLIILVTRFVSVAVVPVFTTLRTLTNSVVQITGLVMNPLQPELIRYYSESAGDKIKSVVQANWMISGIMVNLPLLLIVPFIEDLYRVWTNGVLEFNRELFYMFCLTVSLTNFGRALVLYLTGINDLKSILSMSVVRFVVVFGAGIAMMRSHGLIAIGVGLLIAEMLSSVLIPVYRTSRSLAGMQTEKPLQGAGLALLSVLILCCSFVLDLTTNVRQSVIILVGASLLLAICTIQWIYLTSEVRRRLRSLPEKIIRAW